MTDNKTYTHDVLCNSDTYTGGNNPLDFFPYKHNFFFPLKESYEGNISRHVSVNLI